MSGLRRTAWCGLLLVTLLTACAKPAGPGGPGLHVLRSTPVFAPDGSTLVMLNDALTVYFSTPIDPHSVTQDSVSVLDADGHQVEGRLRIDAQYVSFVPRPPFEPDLLDGSLQPGRDYRLVVAGYPRPDAVTTRDGWRLAAPFVGRFRTETRSPLRPVPDVPPVLPPVENGQIAVDRPRVRMRFTLPVDPTTVRPEAFDVYVNRGARVVPVRPPAARVVAEQALDEELPGCTVELDLAGELEHRDATETIVLQAGDFLYVELRTGPERLLGYGGKPIIASRPVWSVVDGAAITAIEWPKRVAKPLDPDTLLPGFEVVRAGVRAQTRIEAGDGSLGILRPRRDLVLRPGEPFDRGDGVLVHSRGEEFAFLAIDIPKGVTVRLQGPARARLRVAGSVRIDGTLLVDVPVVVASSQLARADVPAERLIADWPVSMVVGGAVQVTGSIASAKPVPDDHVLLSLLCAGACRLSGSLPENSVVAVEPGRSLQWDAPQRKITMTARLTPGVPEGCAIDCAAYGSWMPFPTGLAGGAVAIEGADPRLQVGWQLAPPDPVRTGQPDTRADRLTQVRDLVPGDAVEVPVGHYLRFCLRARVQAGHALPRLAAIRVFAR